MRFRLFVLLFAMASGPVFAGDSGLPGADAAARVEVMASSAKSVAKGKEIFARTCSVCHGDEGLGDGPAGSSLVPRPRNLTREAEFEYGADARSVYRTICYGVPETGMMAFGKALKPAEVWSVIHYIATLRK